MTEISKRIITSLVLLIIIYLSFINSIILFIVLFYISYNALIEFNLIFKKIFQKDFFFYFLTIIASTLYLVIFSNSIWLSLLSLKINNIIPIVFLIVICTSTDIGGYIFGKIFGGKKLTSISPNKTYSGLIGSFVLSLFFGLIFNNFFNIFLDFKINLIFLILLISLISQIGDLFISFLKRKANIKDTGLILPGHGGILDRIDGVLLAVPIGILIISI